MSSSTKRVAFAFLSLSAAWTAPEAAGDELGVPLADVAAEPQQESSPAPETASDPDLALTEETPPADVDAETPSAPSPASETASEPGPALTEVAPLESIPVNVDQTVEPAVADSAPRSRLIEEITVTAQKREELLQDVPISIQAFSDEKLDALGVTNQQDLTKLVPSLNISSLGGFTTVFLRGIGTDAFLTADPSVATYIDGIYFPFALGLTQDFGVLERIEVLKGPQGTLFGRNTTGGALNIVTRDPTLGQIEAQANVTVANYPDLHAKAHLNVPIGEHFAVSVSPIYSKTEHFIRNVHPRQAKPLVDDESSGVRVKMRWAPTEWFDATVAALDLVTDAPSQVVIPTSTNATLLAQLLTAEPEQYQPGSDEARLDGCCEQRADNRVYYGTANFFMPWFDVKILGSDQRIDAASIFDYDGTDRTLVTLSNPSFGADIQTAEVQLISNDDSWGNERFKWIVGGYYFDGIAGHLDNSFLTVELLNDVFNLPDNLLESLGLPPLISTLVGGEIPLRRLFVSSIVATESKSLFAQTTLTFTDWLSLTLGLRYQDESRELIESRLGVLGADDGKIVLLDRQEPVDQQGNRVGSVSREKDLSPKVSIELRPFADDTLAYLSYQEATKSGTYNGVTTAQATFARPESIEAWELGLKTSFLQGTLQFGGAMFYYDLTDLQVQFLAVLTGGSVSFENAEAAEIRGLDFDFVWLIAPHLVDGLALAGSVGWLENAEYTSYPFARGYTNDSGIPTTNADFSGNRIVKTPEYSGTLTLAKTWFLDSGELELAGNVFFSDEFFNEPSNREKTVQPAYETYGARASYLYSPWDLRVTLFGQNLTDKYHSRGIQTTDFGDLTSIGTPRTYGFRLEWNFN